MFGPYNTIATRDSSKKRNVLIERELIFNKRRDCRNSKERRKVARESLGKKFGKE